MVEKKDKIEGVIYSLPLDIAMNIFQKGKKIFVKYMPHEPTKKTVLKLKKGMKIYIYISKSNKSVIGEAKIKEIYYMNMQEIIKKFKNNLMISESELILYAEGRENKKAQVLDLENITVYPKEITVTIPITMGGAYVTSINKRKVFGGIINVKKRSKN